MNFALVSRLLSVIMLILALAFASCLGISLILDSHIHRGVAREAFIASIFTTLAAACLLFWVGRRASSKFFRKEALAVIGLGWILASILGAIPYLIVTPEIGFAGAIFESTSGLTTTGASVLSDLERLPPSLLFWRCLSQWIGGMGVVVFFVAILGFLGAGAKMLYANEASGSVADFDESRAQSTVLKIIYVYSALSAACTLSFHLAGMNWFESLCHMFTTISTGGFSTRSASMGAFENPLIEWIAIIYMIIGGASFLLILKVANRQFQHLKRNTEFLAYLGLLAIGTIVITISLLRHHDFNDIGEAFRASAFQTVSIMTTSGFATVDYVQWEALPKAIFLLFMIVGGCSGSTSGGIKVVRLIVALRTCIVSVERSFRSRVVRQIRMNHRVLSDNATNDIIVYIVLSAVLGMTSIGLASFLEPKTMLDTNISAVISCFFNIGPGLAEIGPTQTYAFFHPYTKLLFSLLMIMGRLELYAVLALFNPSLWKRFH